MFRKQEWEASAIGSDCSGSHGKASRPQDLYRHSFCRIRSKADCYGMLITGTEVGEQAQAPFHREIVVTVNDPADAIAAQRIIGDGVACPQR